MPVAGAAQTPSPSNSGTGTASGTDSGWQSESPALSQCTEQQPGPAREDGRGHWHGVSCDVMIAFMIMDLTRVDGIPAAARGPRPSQLDGLGLRVRVMVMP